MSKSSLSDLVNAAMQVEVRNDQMQFPTRKQVSFVPNVDDRALITQFERENEQLRARMSKALQEKSILCKRIKRAEKCMSALTERVRKLEKSIAHEKTPSPSATVVVSSSTGASQIGSMPKQRRRALINAESALGDVLSVCTDRSVYPEPVMRAICSDRMIVPEANSQTAPIVIRDSGDEDNAIDKVGQGAPADAQRSKQKRTKTVNRSTRSGLTPEQEVALKNALARVCEELRRLRQGRPKECLPRLDSNARKCGVKRRRKNL